MDCFAAALLAMTPSFDDGIQRLTYARTAARPGTAENPALLA
jgi:hypothetical protein